MTGMPGNRRTSDPKEQRWSRGVIISLLFHVLIFSLVLFVPDSMPTRRISGMPVYEVNLVEMPAPRPRAAAVPKTSVEKTTGAVDAPASTQAARRISPPVKEEKPVVIGKRVIERKKTEKKEAVKRPPKPKVSPSRLIDQAVSKIEKKVKSNKSEDHLAKALTRIESKAKTSSTAETPGGGPEAGITIRMYQLAVEEQIKSNWSYPVALMEAKKMRELVAIVLVKVRQDGKIMKSWFKKRSASAIYDGSVLKAIDRSDPLPPFPEGYRRSFDEIEIRFDLSELDDFY